MSTLCSLVVCSGGWTAEIDRFGSHKSWNVKDIKRVGNYVESLKYNKHKKPGEHMTGMWKGVKVTVIKGNNNVPDTICPSYDQPIKKKNRMKKWNSYYMKHTIRIQWMSMHIFLN